MPTSLDDILRHRASGPWRSLETKALQLVKDARQHGRESFAPVLGGGTRLMLALNHRISDDIDLFVDSPAWLPYVSPRLNDRYESSLNGYNEDNAKLFFRGWALTARDLFDWVMLHESAETAISNQAFAKLLSSKLEDIDKALTHMVQRASQQLSWQSIRAPVLPDMQSSAQWARDIVAEWGRLAKNM